MINHKKIDQMEAVPADQRETESNKAFKQKRNSNEPKCFFHVFLASNKMCVYKNMKDILLLPNQ